MERPMLRPICAAALMMTPAFADAQVLSFPAPGPGRTVDFVACPELTAGGSWIATDAASGYTYSLLGAKPVTPNVVIRVSGVVSAEAPPAPGWLLTPITVVAGQQACRSAGVLQPGPSLFGPAPGIVSPVSARY